MTNHERWGKLVKTWATGTNYLEDDNEYPLPTTMDEFKEPLAKAQVFRRCRSASNKLSSYLPTRRRSWCGCRRWG